MIRRLVVTYLAITTFGLALLAIPLGLTFAHREKDRLLFDVERDADTMTAIIDDPLEAGTPVPMTDILRYAKDTGGHVIVVNTHGIALADTEQPTKHLDYSTRPEIKTALQGKRVTGTRHSDDLHTNLVYAAVPVSTEGRVIGAVRITYGTGTLDARVRRMWTQLVLLCLGVLIAAAIVGFVLARSITRPIRRLQSATDQFATGDLSARVEADTGPPELRHLATTFNRMAGRLARLLDAQQRFVADASHQLRTPLTALRLRLENLASHIDDRDRTAVDAATSEVARMSRLIDGLLMLARDDANGTETAPVDVAAVAGDRLDVWQDVVGEKNVALVAALPRAAWARAVPGAVEQLVDNLVDNALAVSPPGSSITVRVESTKAGVELHVIDQGPGLEAASRERAFDRFWRGPDAAPTGSGLGLAIVRRLAEASRGTARLEPGAAGGLDAIVVLPAAVEPRPDDAAAVRAPAPR
ncbi:MAG TPA: ATP-binding protein [Acidimicrobiia bacterium]